MPLGITDHMDDVIRTTPGLWMNVPVLTGLTGIFDVGGDADKSRQNRARGYRAAPADVVGSPSYQPTYATLSAGGYLATLVADSLSATYYLVCRTTSALTSSALYPLLITSNPSQGGGVNARGMDLLVSATTGAPQATLQISLWFYNGTTWTRCVRTMAITNFSLWKLLKITIDESNGVITLFNLTDNPTPQADAIPLSNRPRTLSSTPIRLGAGYVAGSAPGPSDLSFGVTYNRVLSAGEQTSMENWIRARMLAKESITV